jgi:hypothetical protein
VKGAVKEARRALARVFARRELALTAEHQARIDAEEDVRRLERWHDAALTAATLDEVFADA